MKCLGYLGILIEGFSPYSSPVLLISQKLMQDKRVLIDFRHLNIRIVKNNLAYPLVRATFSVLGNSKCEVLSVLDLKDEFHSLRLSVDSKEYSSILPYLSSVSYMYQRMSMGLNISPSILAILYKCNFRLLTKVENIVKQLWMIYYFSHLQRKCTRLSWKIY